MPFCNLLVERPSYLASLAKIGNLADVNRPLLSPMVVVSRRAFSSRAPKSPTFHVGTLEIHNIRRRFSGIIAFSTLF